jgi:hypothetical protein
VRPGIVRRRLQGGVHAGRSTLLLPADDHQLRQPPPLRLRGPSTTKEAMRPAIRGRFRECGLPKAICNDDRVPFASPNALDGLRKLSVEWLGLGIEIEGIKPGNPQQNGRAPASNPEGSWRPPSRPEPTSLNSRASSMISSAASTPSACPRGMMEFWPR